MFAICGRLVGHLSVCRWLRVAGDVNRLRVSITTKGLCDWTDNAFLRRMLTEAMDRVSQVDLCRGKWYVTSKELDILVDMSSLIIGVLLELHRTIIKDMCWLQQESDTQHIILMELDAVIRGVNLAVHWNAKFLHLKTYSLFVNWWLTNTLIGKAKVSIKSESKMLIWRHLDIFLELVREYALVVDIMLVRSNQK